MKPEVLCIFGFFWEIAAPQHLNSNMTEPYKLGFAARGFLKELSKIRPLQKEAYDQIIAQYPVFSVDPAKNRT
jgi:hypothetical protein